MECNYDSATWGNLGRIYHCEVQNSISVTSLEESIITSITGIHKFGRNSEYVRGFWIDNKIVHYFPKGLSELFENLVAISICRSQLKEINQSNLREFPNLLYIQAYGNDIEVLEEGLFDLNPKLSFIDLGTNKISKVHPDIFKNLIDLVYLYFNGNSCIDEDAKNDVSAVRNLIQHVITECPIPIKSIDSECPKVCLSKIGELTSITLSNIDSLNKIKNTVEIMKENIPKKHNETFVNFDERADIVEDKVVGNDKQIEDINLKLKEIHDKILQSMDPKFGELKKEVNDKIGNLEEKLDKILKALNITE